MSSCMAWGRFLVCPTNFWTWDIGSSWFGGAGVCAEDEYFLDAKKEPPKNKPAKKVGIFGHFLSGLKKGPFLAIF